jgi:hypothetical protein
LGFRRGGLLSEQSRGGRSNFYVNAIEQLPHFGQVVSHTFQHGLWIVIVFSILELLMLGFLVVAKRVEKEMDNPRGNR